MEEDILSIYDASNHSFSTKEERVKSREAMKNRITNYCTLLFEEKEPIQALQIGQILDFYFEKTGLLKNSVSLQVGTLLIVFRFISLHICI